MSGISCTNIPMYINDDADENDLTEKEVTSLIYNLIINSSEKNEKNIIKQIDEMNMNIEILIDLYYKILEKTKCDCEYDEHQEQKEQKNINDCNICRNKINYVRRLLVKELTKKWQYFDVKYSNKLSYSLVKDFLQTDDFSHSCVTEDKMYDLESFLLRMFINLCKKKEISNDQFEDLFDLIHWECVNKDTVLILCKLKQYNSLMAKSKKFATKFADMFVTLSGCGQKSRFKQKETDASTDVITDISISSSSSVQASFTQNLKDNQLTFDDIKIGGEYEVKDRVNKWFIARVIVILNKTITVHYFGFGQDEDEIFTREKIVGRFAKIGTHTNGEKHNGGYECKCIHCKKE